MSAHIGRDAVTDEAIREMLREWCQPAAEERASTVPARRLRFAEAGRVLTHSQIGEWARLVALALTGHLPDGVAPCTPHLSGDPDGVRSLSREEVDWSTLEPREWAMLERAGLPRVMRLRLQAGELDDPAPAPQNPRLAAAEALLATLDDGPAADQLAAAADAVREALYGRTLAATNGSRRDAAKLLGVAPARVAEALRDFPALAERWPAGPRGPRPRDA